MSLLSHNDLVGLVQHGVIDAPLEAVRGASIDVRLSAMIFTESAIPRYDTVIDPRESDVSLRGHIMLPSGYLLGAKEFVLGATVERFNLPPDLCAEFKLKSSVARLGISHCLATWIDPGFVGNLTLELYNVRQRLAVLLLPDMPIGQILFHRIDAVPTLMEYGMIGRYQGDQGAQPSRGIDMGGNHAG